MKTTCPSCKALIPASRLNIEKDVAVCEKCNEVFAISELMAGGQPPEGFDLQFPPSGAWHEETDSGWRIGATTRSPQAFFLVPFMCVWSGGSLGGIYGMQIAAGEFNLLFSLFGIPFLIGSLVLGAYTLMAICGSVIVAADGDQGSVFEGVGRFGRTRRFDWDSIATVEEIPYGYRTASSQGFVISLVGKSRLQFGAMLSDPRRYYLLQGLRKLLGERKV